MGKIRNIPLRKYIKFLEKQGCKCNRTKGSHKHYSRADLNRPLTIQSNIDPVPTFIILQHLRYLNLDKNEFLSLMDEL